MSAPEFTDLFSGRQTGLVIVSDEMKMLQTAMRQAAFAVPLGDAVGPAAAERVGSVVFLIAKRVRFFMCCFFAVGD